MQFTYAKKQKMETNNSFNSLIRPSLSPRPPNRDKKIIARKKTNVNTLSLTLSTKFSLSKI